MIVSQNLLSHRLIASLSLQYTQIRVLPPIDRSRPDGLRGMIGKQRSLELIKTAFLTTGSGIEHKNIHQMVIQEIAIRLS